MKILIFEEIFISAQNSRRLKWNSRRFPGGGHPDRFRASKKHSSPDKGQEQWACLHKSCCRDEHTINTWIKQPVNPPSTTNILITCISFLGMKNFDELQNLATCSSLTHRSQHCPLLPHTILLYYPFTFPPLRARELGAIITLLIRTTLGRSCPSTLNKTVELSYIVKPDSVQTSMVFSADKNHITNSRCTSFIQSNSNTNNVNFQNFCWINRI